MSVDRLSVTVPAKLGAALRALAEARGTTVSDVVAEAIAHEIRLAALDRALDAADHEFGKVDEKLVLAAEVELTRATGRARPKRRRRS